jgi:hypothetical protein
MKKLILVLLIFPLLIYGQTYIVKDQYGFDTGIRIEKDVNPYLAGFYAAGGGKLDYEKSGNTVIINNYNAKSGNLKPIYSTSSYFSSGYANDVSRAEKKYERKEKKQAKKLRGPCWYVYIRNYPDLSDYFVAKNICKQTEEFQKWKKKNKDSKW